MNNTEKLLVADLLLKKASLFGKKEEESSLGRDLGIGTAGAGLGVGGTLLGKKYIPKLMQKIRVQKLKKMINGGGDWADAFDKDTGSIANINLDSVNQLPPLLQKILKYEIRDQVR